MAGIDNAGCQLIRKDEGIKKKSEPEEENLVKDHELEDGCREKEENILLREIAMEVRKRKRARVKNGIKSEGELENREHRWTEVLSLKPRASIYHNFLTKEECKHLISLAEPHLTRSRIRDVKIPEGKISSFRTSSGMFLRRGQDKVIMDIEKRIAEYTTIPIGQGSSIQVLHYKRGQKFDPHYDYFSDKVSTQKEGQRMATLVMYLSDVEEGGETIFPEAEGNNLMPCGKRGLSVKPKMGDALLFWNLHPDLTPDPSSLHGSCRVIKGSKWAATMWMHVREVKAY